MIATIFSAHIHAIDKNLRKAAHIGACATHDNVCARLEERTRLTNGPPTHIVRGFNKRC